MNIAVEPSEAAGMSAKRLERIGPAGISTIGRCPKLSAPMTRPGTILSQMPSRQAASKVLWERATAVDSAITSREISESSIPGSPCVMPSHIAGTPPATIATPPAARAASRISSG